MYKLTFITPIAPSHRALVGRCIDSVQKQTIACQHFVHVDEGLLGPGAIRNKLLQSVDTEFVSFVDADDWVEPNFAERTLDTFRGKYIYTDWFQDGEIIKAPDLAWTNHSFHLVTALVPTEWALKVGGFDENLPGMEDTDFYVKMVTSGLCGERLAVPLVHYRAGGGRAATIHATGKIEALNKLMKERYGGKTVCTDCADPRPPDPPVGEHLPGDVLARALWHGNRTERGLATGRRYPRIAYPKTCYVSPHDVKMSPRLWEVIPDPLTQERTEERAEPRTAEQPRSNKPRGLDALAARMGLVEPKKPKPPTPKREPGVYTPDIARVKRLAQKTTSHSSLYFVRPEEDYPSYSDFWRLVELACFPICSTTFAQMNLSSPSMTFIFVSPVKIPSCTKARARTIFWQFEYAGEYARQRNRTTCSEQWSSDPWHAEQTGAKYVLLGSDPRLYEQQSMQYVKKWDIITLSYLTDRRRTIYEQISHSFAPDYPGHSGQLRHEQLCLSGIMLHVHQHDEPAIAPIKMALAAAYHLPVICEAVNDPGLYQDCVYFSSYDNLPRAVGTFLEGQTHFEFIGEWLHELLCVEHSFEQCVMDALGSGS